mmetsp:Transcript_136694/g.241073  ORF Transcript_136694/g.241073 Transcript_136694/m.241073 type:complete len:634 (+) Transcript_136694:3-1904(+)
MHRNTLDMCFPISCHKGCLAGLKAAPLPQHPCAHYLDVPQDSGLVLALSASGACSMKIVRNMHAKDFHPNMHVPASLDSSLRELAGGGSGATVLSAMDPQFGSVVLKHGNHKDARELLALATIAQELRRRGETVGSIDAATDLVKRTPDFKYIYISSGHLYDKSFYDRRRSSPALLRSRSATMSEKDMCEMRSQSHDSGLPVRVFSKPSLGIMDVNAIRICNLAYQQERGVERKENVKLVDGRLEVYLALDAKLNERTDCLECSAFKQGYGYLKDFVHHFSLLQERYNWKVTLAQKAVGGKSSEIASVLLANTALNKSRLTTLIDEKIALIRKLQALTLSEEREAFPLSKAAAGANLVPSEISSTADLYLGGAIKKNFHPETGRFQGLRKIGELFREDWYAVAESEELPVRNLGVLLKEGARLEEVFAQVSGPTALDTYSDIWHEVLEHASSLQGSKAGACIWTGGLTDGGLHNMFLDEDYLWLFDMGDPVLMSLPGFLTKFLFSFFHTLGMQETACGTAWVNRFVPGEILHLTAQTMTALQSARESFTQTLDRLISEVFHGEEAVRQLLMKYVILQLLSDCAFCLERWETKGGGSGRTGLEKWLWRALWDFYISADLAQEGMAASCGKKCGA